MKPKAKMPRRAWTSGRGALAAIALLLLAFGLVMILEGLVYALAPSLLERMLEALRQFSLSVRRQIGALAVISGLIFLWMAQQFGG